MTNYEAVIGLEVHVQARTESKMFCPCPNRYGAEPNTLVCPVCMGYPGSMPTPNREAIRKTLIAGLLCSAEVAEYSKFDRKSYFYPDMPKNYQISQYDLPFCSNGRIRIEGKGFSGTEMEPKTIGVTRIHLEEDVAKSIHYSGYSGIDFNRAGVPLMEIVSEPDMRTPDEAHAYLSALKQIMQYADISDCDMEKGQMRCDVNVSVRVVGDEQFGTKIEVKNLNSFRSVHRALEHEIDRQIDVLEDGGTLRQETRGWDDDAGVSHLLRSKEDAHDYRYFPEPDLMPVCFSKTEIDELCDELPELPDAKRQRFIDTFDLTEYDAEVLTQDKTLADYFEAAAKDSKNPKIVANWIISEMLRELGEAKIDVADCAVKPADLRALVDLIDEGTISGKIAKTVFGDMFKTGRPPQEIVEEKGLIQVSDESAIDQFVVEAIESNPAQVQQYKEGKTKVLQFFVGQVMKLSRGKANPQMAVKALKEKLDAC